ncbi:CHAT domain-containing protein [Microbacterium sp.]|uniref:CHAT domain-containing protein n=1 Tax=Microbacterium sp. TaxID=51671 RepID=UPI0039E4CE22
MTSDPAARYEHALVLANARRYEDAERALDAAARATTDADLRARISGTRAFVLDQTGRSAEGARVCRAALATDGLSAHTRGVLAGQLGSIFMHQGRLEDAAEWLGTAIDTIPEDPLAVANLRMNRSMVAMQRRDFVAGAADLTEAAKIYAAQGDPVGAAEAQHNLGYLALLAGDLVSAMREMATARPVIAGISAANAAIGDVDRAEALRDAGLTTEAERALADAATVFGRNRMPQARAEAEFHLSRSLLRHDPARAARVARTAAGRFAALGARSWAARADAVRLRAGLAEGTIDRAGRRVRTRRAAVDGTEVARLAARLTRAGLHNDAAALRLDHTLWRTRHGDAAGRLPALPTGAALEVRLLAQEVRAERAAASGREALARRRAAEGLDELTDWRSSFGSLDMQTSLAMHANGLILAGLASAVRSRRPDVVFEWSERARQLSMQVVPLRPPPDPDAAADLAELRMLRADLTGTDWTSDPRVIEVGARLRHRQWTTTGGRRVEAAVGLDDAVAALDGGTALLAYVFSPAGLGCLVVTDAGAQFIDLPGWESARAALPGLRADLDMSAALQAGPMAQVVRRALSGRAQALSAQLLAPALACTDAARLVITVPGVLSGMPWGILPDMRGRAFTLATSASHWVHGRRVTAAGPAGLAGFAVGPRVARGEEEAVAAASVWPAPPAILRGEAAGVADVSGLAGRVEVLHIAAHGRHAVDNPMFSGLELADGTLFGYDIDQIPRMPATVVLSACEVGRSAVRWGEEAVGMTRAWLHAGAGCVVAAPVVVADDDACELLAALHRGLADGVAPGLALAAAAEQTGIRSAFQCYGDGF